jgi:DNA-binding MarR family transcriptional regulator
MLTTPNCCASTPQDARKVLDTGRRIPYSRTIVADRPSEAAQEKRRGVVRALHTAELEQAGRFRAAALEEADRQLDRIARLLPDALSGGLNLTEIARITGVSRPTLYELRARYGESASDLHLAVLQSLATRGAQELSDLRRQIGRPLKDIRPVLDSFVKQGFIDEDVDVDGPEEPRMLMWLTSKGEALLEHWEFEETIAADEERERP